MITVMITTSQERLRNVAVKNQPRIYNINLVLKLSLIYYWEVDASSFNCHSNCSLKITLCSAH